MRWIAGIVALLLLVGCHRTQPQRPTYHGQSKADTTAVQLLTLNQKMANEADLQLTRLATEGYVLMEENYWVKGLGESSSDEVLSSDEYISLEAEIYDMQGRLLTQHRSDVQVGKVDEIQAIVYVLPLMRRDMAVSMLVPWYLAFGSAGNHEVKPFENIRVELKINSIR